MDNDEKKVSVWEDDTSEPGTICWVVSLDDLDDAGGSTTLAIFSNREKAVERGEAEAAGRKIPMEVTAKPTP